MTNPIRLLIVDDHAIVREGLKALLDTAEAVSVVGQAANGIEALAQAAALKPDVVLMDISMPAMDGLAATQKFQEYYPDIKVLILSMHQDAAYVQTILKAGARGYLTKNNANEAELVQAITTVHQGAIYIDAQASNYLFIDTPVSTTHLSNTLSARELEILKLLVQGASNKIMARQLHISDRTVETHRINIHRKLGTKTTAELVKYAYAQQLI